MFTPTHCIITPAPSHSVVFVMLFVIFHSCLKNSDGAAALSLPTSLRDWRHVTPLSLCLLWPEPEPGSARPAIGRPSPHLASDWSIPGLSPHCQGQAGPAESVLARARGVFIKQPDLSET